MNEPIIKEPMFPIRSKEEIAYIKYHDQAKQYTTPLTFDEWKREVKNFKFGC